MTTLIGKLQEITKRLQQLTVWRPNERDPFCELDRWRTDAHTMIEQIYHRKKQQIEQLMEKHEREFMRQITRQRFLLNSIKKRLLPQKEISTYNRIQNEPSILTDMQKIENDINTKLGRAEISIETIPFNLEDSVIVSLKTYLSPSSSMYIKELSTRNQPKKPVQRSPTEITHAFDNWVQVKKTDQINLTQRELQSARQNERNASEHRLMRQKSSEKAYNDWLNRKNNEDELIKKLLSTNGKDIKQET